MKRIVLAGLLAICLCAHATAAPGILPVEKAIDTRLAVNEQTTANISSETNKCGENITWTLENGVLTLTGTGATYNYSWDNDYKDNPPPWFEQKDEITEIKLSEGITELGNFSLVGCTAIQTITLPSTLKAIGERVFMDWINLVSIELPDGLCAIGEGAFEWNDMFSKIVIPRSVTSIAVGAFECCGNLTIYGYTGSVAQKYATDNQIPFVSMGKPSIADNKEVKKLTSAILSNLQDIGGELKHTLNYYVGDDDINGEPKINIKDLIALAQMLSANNG